MRGPSVRTRAPLSSAPSTISTARSTPKQNPNSSASRTCIEFLICDFKFLICDLRAVGTRRSTFAKAKAERRVPSIANQKSKIKISNRLRPVGRRGRRVAASPLLAQPVGGVEALVNPADVLLGEPAHAAPEVFLELAQVLRRVARQNRERGVAQKAQRVAHGVSGLVPQIVCVSHPLRTSSHEPYGQTRPRVPHPHILMKTTGKGKGRG